MELITAALIGAVVIALATTAGWTHSLSVQREVETALTDMAAQSFHHYTLYSESLIDNEYLSIRNRNLSERNYQLSTDLEAAEYSASLLRERVDELESLITRMSYSTCDVDDLAEIASIRSWSIWDDDSQPF